MQKIWDSELGAVHVVGGKAYSASVQVRELEGAILQLYIDFMGSQNKLRRLYHGYSHS